MGEQRQADLFAHRAIDPREVREIDRDAGRAAGEAARDAGVDLAARAHAAALDLAKAIARQLGQRQPTVTADDVRERMPDRWAELGNAAGSIFRGREWKHIGYVRSSSASRHAAAVSVWRYIGS